MTSEAMLEELNQSSYLRESVETEAHQDVFKVLTTYRLSC